MPTAEPSRWATDRSQINASKRPVSFTSIQRHILIDSDHRPAGSSVYDYRVYFGFHNQQVQSQSERIRNVTSINCISAEIPRTADNIIDGRNHFYIRMESSAQIYRQNPLDGSTTATVTLTSGLYYTEADIITELNNQLQALNVTDGQANDSSYSHFTAEITPQNRLRIYCQNQASGPHGFEILATTDTNATTDTIRKTLAYQLGLVTGLQTSSKASPDPTTGMVATSTYPNMIEAARFTNLMPRSYVDLVIPEIPFIGTKLTNSPRVGRVIARIPLGSTPGGSQHYEPTTSLVLDTQFHPVSLAHITVQLFGSDGEFYESRDTPHFICLQIAQLSDPLIAHPKRQPREIVPIDLKVDPEVAERPLSFVDEHWWTIAGVTAGAAATVLAIMRLKSIFTPPQPVAFV